MITKLKTPQALGAAHELLASGKAKKILVVCPASLKYQWASEVEKFTGYTSIVIDGSKKKREKQYIEWQESLIDFCVSGYESIRSDIDLVKTLGIDVIILDEAQKIKNRSTKLFKAFIQLQPEYRFVLTGTPMTNKPEEIFALMKWVDGDIFGGVTKFNQRHIVKGEKFGRRFIDLGYKNLDDIREKISPVLMRRLKKEVAPDLPDIVKVTARCDMTKPQRTLYEAVVEDFMVLQEEIKEFHANLSESDARENKRFEKEDAVLGYLYMLQAISNHPLLLTQGESKLAKKYLPLVRKCPTSPKLELLMDELAPVLESGSKVVIFSRYVRMLVFLKERIEAQFKQEPYVIHGGVKAEERQAQVEDFNVNPTRQIFLLSDAGASGLNLQVSDFLVNYDEQWSLSNKIQREGRIHRINSEYDKVTIMTLVTNETLDETIQSVIQGKINLNDGLVERNDNEKSIMKDLLSKMSRPK